MATGPRIDQRARRSTVVLGPSLSHNVPPGGFGDMHQESARRGHPRRTRRATSDLTLWVEQSRQEQGHAPTVTDPAALRRIAVLFGLHKKRPNRSESES